MAAKPPNKEDKAASDDLAAELRPIEADIDALERSAGSLAALRDEMLSSGRRKVKEAYEAQLGEVDHRCPRDGPHPKPRGPHPGRVRARAVQQGRDQAAAAALVTPHAAPA